VLAEVEHPKLGKIKLLKTSFKFSETTAGVRAGPPLCGEHTREVLSNILGYSESRIIHLLKEGVI
jgi:succinate--hydroxymethylglutarate CoA-transferase